MNSKLEEAFKLDQEVILLIKSFKSTQEIINRLSIKKRDLIKSYYRMLIKHKQLLTSEEYQFLLQEYLVNCIFYEFTTEKIAIISDTHLASKYENPGYLKQVRDFLKENKIKYLLHGGDIGDGMVQYHKAYSTYPKQIEHILEVYDLETDTIQFLLGGNHDKNYRRKNEEYDILSLLEENNPNITAVGYYQSYFKVGNNVVSFQHASRYNKHFVGRDLSILGHSHRLAYKDSTIILPTLSDSFPNSQQSTQPGFITMKGIEYEKEFSLEVESYQTTENGLEVGKSKIYHLTKH